MKEKHLRPSVTTRNAAIITRVNKGATSTELAAEYKVQWDTIRDSIRNKHYQVDSRPNNMPRYREFLAKVRANDAAAAARASHAANSSSSQASTNQEDISDKSAGTPVTANTTPVTTTAAADNRPCINLVETGVLLHLGVDSILALNEGNNVYWIPRFCIDELIHMEDPKSKADASVKAKAKSALLKIYAEDVWNIRIIPFEPVEQGLIPKTPDVSTYKPRSFGVAEAALELYIDSNKARVNVLTTAMEIQHLLIRAIKAENIGNDVTVTRMFVK